MAKRNIKKAVSKTIVRIGMKIAYRDTNQACAMFIYQPKRPKHLKVKNT